MPTERSGWANTTSKPAARISTAWSRVIASLVLPREPRARELEEDRPCALQDVVGQIPHQGACRRQLPPEAEVEAEPGADRLHLRVRRPRLGATRSSVTGNQLSGGWACGVQVDDRRPRPRPYLAAEREARLDVRALRRRRMGRRGCAGRRSQPPSDGTGARRTTLNSRLTPSSEIADTVSCDAPPRAPPVGPRGSRPRPPDPRVPPRARPRGRGRTRGGCRAWSVDLGLAVLALWLVAKDWRDLVPRQRDTATWRLGLHRRAAPLRGPPRGSMPACARRPRARGGVVNLVSALTPNSAGAATCSSKIEPVESRAVFHALAVPASAGLIVDRLLPQRRRRARAQRRGGTAGRARRPEPAQGPRLRGGRDLASRRPRSSGGAGRLPRPHDQPQPPLAPPRSPAVLAATARRRVVAGDRRAGPPRRRSRRDRDCCSGARARSPSATRPGCRSPSSRSRWRPARARLPRLPAARAARRARRARSAGRRRARARARQRHARLLQAPPRQAVPLRSDRRAFVGYRIENGVLLVSGDPVGDRRRRCPSIAREPARSRSGTGLRLGAVGVERGRCPALARGGAARALHRRRGDRRDRAVLARRPGDPEGAPVGAEAGEGRVLGRAAGARAARRRDPRRARGACPSVGARERPSVVSRWRWTRSTRAHQPDSVVVLARDGEGRDSRLPPLRPELRPPGNVALVHAPRLRHAERFDGVPGRARQSSSGERGIEEISLNFAAFARLIRAQGAGAARPSRSSTASSRSSACTGSTRNSTHAGSRATSSSRARSDCRASASQRCWSRGSCRGSRSRARETLGPTAPCADRASARPLDDLAGDDAPVA